VGAWTSRGLVDEAARDLLDASALASPSNQAGMSSQTQMRNRDEVLWLMLLMFVGFSVAVFSHYLMGFYLGQPYPYNTFLSNPLYRFSDLYQTWLTTGNPSPYLGSSATFPSSYLPFTHLILKPLTWLPYFLALPLFLVSTAAAILWLLAAQLREVALPLRLVTASVIGLLNYPVLLMLDRGNVESLILLLVAGSALNARRGAWKWSAVLIGAAAAMKGYPLLFVLVLVGARRYRDAAVAVVTAAGLTLVSFMTFSGGLLENARALIHSLGTVFAINAGEIGVQHGSSLSGLASAVAHTAPAMSWLPETVAPISLAVLLVGAIGVASGRLALWQSFAVVAGLTVLVPSVSFDYRLVLLMVPLVVLLREPGGSLRRPSLLLIGLLFVPKGLPILYGGVSLGVVVNPLLLLLLVLGLTSAAVHRPTGGH
jgi:Glycosyltransferase family 87